MPTEVNLQYRVFISIEQVASFLNLFAIISTQRQTILASISTLWLNGSRLIGLMVRPFETQW
jgi:hypothetical protein